MQKLRTKRLLVCYLFQRTPIEHGWRALVLGNAQTPWHGQGDHQQALQHYEHGSSAE